MKRYNRYCNSDKTTAVEDGAFKTLTLKLVTKYGCLQVSQKSKHTAWEAFVKDKATALSVTKSIPYCVQLIPYLSFMIASHVS